jgi:hypothetical protein
MGYTSRFLAGREVWMPWKESSVMEERLVPARIAHKAADAAQARQCNEADKRERLVQGVLGLDMYKMREPLAKAGLKYID